MRTTDGRHRDGHERSGDGRHRDRPERGGDGRHRDRPERGGVGGHREAGPRVAFVRLLAGLGDMLCLVPALRAVRTAAPEAEVTVVGVPAARWLAERRPDLIDRWVDVPHWPGIPEAVGDPAVTGVALARARAAGLDLALQVHGTGWHVNDLTRALGARSTGGFHPPAEPSPGDGWLPWPDRGHEIDRCLAVVRAAGFPDAGREMDLPERPGDLDAAAPVLAALAGASAVIVHPGASRADRRWDPAGFASVADAAAAAGHRVVVTAGPGEEPLARSVADRCATAPIVAAGLPLGGLAALVRRSAAVVANDTGVAHLAVACGTATVVVVTTSDADRWGPIDRVRHRVVRVAYRPTPAAAAHGVAVALAEVLAGSQPVPPCP